MLTQSVSWEKTSDMQEETHNDWTNNTDIYMFEALHVIVDHKKINVVWLFFSRKGLYYFDI